MERRYKEIILKWGELQGFAEELHTTKNTIKNAVRGYFTTTSRNYENAIAIRRHILDAHPERYKGIKE